MTIPEKKPILCIYAGYSPNIFEKNTTWAGSELMLKKLAENLTDEYDVHVFGTNYALKNENEVKYLNKKELEHFQEKNDIEILIISRYAHYFVEYPLTAKKIFLWAHDHVFNSYWNYKNLKNLGKNIIKYQDKKINAYITLTTWHKENIKKIYDLNPEKIKIIGNALDEKEWTANEEKIKNRFIWASSPTRGLKTAINCFKKASKSYPDAELIICWDEIELKEDIMSEINKHNNIHFLGKKSNKDLIKEFQKAEYWFYPTKMAETYCLNALEAQRAGCVCITTNMLGLRETVNDRGILININENTTLEELEETALITLLETMQNEALKQKLKEKGISWAKKQNWDERIKEWKKLLKE